MTSDIPNLSLNFLNPESRRITNLYSRFSRQRHESYLCSLLNLHVMWCGEYCVTQPGVSFECAIAEAALRKKKQYLLERFIRIPMKSMDIYQFLDERRHEYKARSDYFPDLFDDRDFILPEIVDAIIPKLHSTGANIASNWDRFLNDGQRGDLPKWVQPNDIDSLRRLSPLVNRVIQRGDPLTWPEIDYRILSEQPIIEREKSRLWLQHLYLIDYTMNNSLSVMTEIPSIAPEIGYLQRNARCDYTLIRDVLNFWHLFPIIEDMEDHRIIRIRKSAEFWRFRYVFDDVAVSVRHFSKIKNIFAIVSRNVPLKGDDEIIKLLRSAQSGKINIGVNRLITLFGFIADETEKLVKSDDYIDNVHITSIVRKNVMNRQMTLSLDTMEQPMPNKKIFIGHGRSSVWKDLKMFLNDRLKLNVEEFGADISAGKPTATRLQEMLNNSTFAFLIMTAEDEDASGSMRARENVVHEAGLFQGRLGFDKAIILLEEGCNEFSNIVGLGQIRFPKGNIDSVKDEIRRVLEANGVL